MENLMQILQETTKPQVHHDEYIFQHTNGERLMRG